MFSSSSAHLSQKDIMEIVEYQSQTRVPSPPPPQLQSGASGGHGQKVRIYLHRDTFSPIQTSFGLTLQTAGSVTAKGEGGGGKHKNGNGSSNGAASSYAAVVTNSNAYTRRGYNIKMTNNEQ